MSLPTYGTGSTHSVFKNTEKSAQGLIEALKGALSEAQGRPGGRVGVVADLVRGESAEKPLIKGKIKGKEKEAERAIPVREESIVPRKGVVI